MRCNHVYRVERRVAFESPSEYDLAILVRSLGAVTPLNGAALW
jgi:hypothetical protein